MVDEKVQVFFNTVALEVNGDFVFVNVEFFVTTNVVTSSVAFKMEIGDNIRVEFNGDIMESDSSQIGTVMQNIF